MILAMLKYSGLILKRSVGIALPVMVVGILSVLKIPLPLLRYVNMLAIKRSAIGTQFERELSLNLCTYDDHGHS
jgi:hypothetical protein